MKQKFFTIFLALIASAGTIFAQSGTCGDNLTWNLTNGVLTISGTGDMTNWEYESQRPWHSYHSSIKTVTIGNSVTSIGNYAFYNCTSLTSITIPNSVTSIGSGAFSRCSGLTSITIPNSVTSIGSSAFNGCTGLTEVTIGNGVTSIGNEAFHGCIVLTSITIPNGVTSIGSDAFSGCHGLTSITIPNSVTSIGYRAFFACTGLTSVTIGNSVTSIAEWAFNDCTGLTSVVFLNPNTLCDGYGFFNGCESLETVVCPASAFRCSAFNLDNMPSHIKTIDIIGGELSEDALLAINRSYRTLETIDCSAATNTSLSDEAFKNCYNLHTLLLPANLTSISYMALAGCKNLQSIDIPASVETIEQSAFEDCRSLQTITFGGAASPAPGIRKSAATTGTSQLRTIGNWAFYNAHQLQNLTLPEGVEEIGDGAFYGCTYLENLSLPSSIQRLGDNCFALCSKMKSIDVQATTPPVIQAKTFFDVKRSIPVYVPAGSENNYTTDTYWKEFNIHTRPTALEEIINNQSQFTNQKILHDGQIYILRDGKVFDLSGRKL